jgi:hypothetical protein
VQRENTKLAAGQPIEPNPWDNHAAHIALHNRFRKGQQFEMLPEEIRELFAQHVQMHEQMHFQQQAVAMLGDPSGGAGAPGGLTGGGAPGEGPPDPSGGEGPGAPGGPGGSDLGTLGLAAGPDPSNAGG